MSFSESKSFQLIFFLFIFLAISRAPFFKVIYELKAGGVDQRRLVGAKLEKLAEGESGLVAFFLI